MALSELAPWHWGKKEARLPVRREENSDPFEVLRREMNRMFDGFVTDSPMVPWGQLGNSWNDGFSPRVEMSETEGEVQIKAELPGLTEKEVDVSLSDGVLVLKGEKKQEKQETRNGRQYSECSYGLFQREIPLHSEVQVDKAEATFKNGLLSIRIPKTAEAKAQTHKIQVKQA